MENEQEKQGKKPLIPARVFLVGEGKIPRGEIDRTEDEHLKIFLREPNPKNWPEEIAHFVKYLPDQERIRWKVAEFLKKHEGIIRGALRNWAIRLREDMASDKDLLVSDPDAVLQEVEKYLSSLLRDTLFHDNK